VPSAALATAEAESLACEPVSVVQVVTGAAALVSIVSVTVLSGSAPSALTLPAASANRPLATLTTPGAVLCTVGVKSAV